MKSVLCDQCGKELGGHLEYKTPILQISVRGGPPRTEAKMKKEPIFRVGPGEADLCSLACGVLFLKERMGGG